MAKARLERLRSVDPRSVWRDEARDFTPWLLENADLLQEALGIDLELQAAEHPVGSFSLDLIGRDLAEDSVLIVENQLGMSDHYHLGQIMTYAAGTDARTVVWIATDFKEEHRQAIDWLNEHTDDDVRMFGLRVGVRQIGDSAPAPVFEVVAQPNDWQRQVRAATRAAPVSDRRRRYLDYWTRFLEALQTGHPDWPRTKAAPRNGIGLRSPIRRTWLGPAFVDRDRLTFHLWIDVGDGNRNKKIFDAIHAQKAAFETAYGRPVEWERREDLRSSKIADYSEGSIEDTDRYDEFTGWFIDAGERFYRAFEAIDLSGI